MGNAYSDMDELDEKEVFVPPTSLLVVIVVVVIVVYY